MTEFLNESEPIMPIGVVARKLGVSVSTVRLYEKEDLLSAARSPSGRRLYCVNDVLVASKVKELIREHGLNFAGVRAFFATIPCWRIAKCPAKVRNKCTAYRGQFAPCWSHLTEGCVRNGDRCSSCIVYAAVAQTPLAEMAHMLAENDRFPSRSGKEPQQG
jgi:MerR family transcriptional regulator/heat shock protein HspR